MNRFVEPDFDTKKLPPIYDYSNERLVTLEQALTSIVPIIDQLNESTQAAKKYCHFPSEHGLTLDESAALYLYTIERGNNSFYRVLNHVLRCEDHSAAKSWFPFLKLLDTALSKLPTVSKVIWRGVIGNIGHDLKKDQELTWWSVSSCSLSVNVIKDFLSPENQSTIFLIEAVHGKNISGYTSYPNEDEVILAPGTRLKVVANALDLPGGINIVHLVEMHNDSNTRLSSTTPTPHCSLESMDKSAPSEY